MAVIERAAISILDFTQTATSNIKWKHIRHRLKMSDALHASPVVEAVQHQLWFQQVATVRRSIYNLSVGNLLVFDQEATPRALQEFIDQWLVLIDEVKAVNTKGSQSGMTLTQSVSVVVVKHNPVDSFTLTQDVTFELKKSTDIAQTLALSHGVSVYKPDKNYIVPGTI